MFIFVFKKKEKKSFFQKKIRKIQAKKGIPGKNGKVASLKETVKPTSHREFSKTGCECCGSPLHSVAVSATTVSAPTLAESCSSLLHQLSPAPRVSLLLEDSQTPSWK